MLPYLYFISLSLLVMISLQSADASESWSLASPDGELSLTLQIKRRMEPYPAGNRLYYSLSYKGTSLLLDSPTAIELKNMEQWSSHFKVLKTTKSSQNQKWTRVWGKRKQVVDSYNQIIVECAELDAPQRKIHYCFRLYNDGLAFRYVLPEQDRLKEFKLGNESTEFHFPANLPVWAANYNGFVSHQEAEFNRSTLNQLSSTEVYGCPMLIKGESVWMAITEANLQDWAGMYLTCKAGSRNTLVTVLSPRPDEPDVLVKSKTPRSSPWRVLMIGDTPGALIESDIIDNLNEPCEIKDTSWIQPGRCAWDRWWSNDYAPEVAFPVGMNNATMKYFIDFAAEMGWEYQLVDWHWYGPPFNENWQTNWQVDILHSTKDINIPELVQYARAKNVKLLLWLAWEHADKQMNEAFALYEKWGVSGVKIDFMQRDDQDMVHFYERVVKKAAEHHLTVDFHGAYKPTGECRTWPNLLTREGVMGNEYNKWSSRITPEHCVTLPFTRMLAGPMDFTPGGFRQKMPRHFPPAGGDKPSPYVMGTRCFQLAMMIIYESPLQVLCDSPYNYRSSPAGLDFLKIVPVTWDDTAVLAGQPGDFIAMARRSGKDWYIGCMTDTTARDIELSLNFLDQGRYNAEIWQDAFECQDYPDRLMKGIQEVTAKDKIVAKLSAAGGFVMVLRPLEVIGNPVAP